MQCPAPILALSKTARGFGKQPMLIEVLSDDPDFPKDLQAWCRTTHSEICDSEEDNGQYRVLIGINGATELLSADEHVDLTEAAVADAPTPVEVPAPAFARVASAEPRRGQQQVTQMDLRGMRAPEPVRQLSAALVTTPGSHVRVISDDPGFMSDVMAWSRAAGVTVLSAQHQPEATVVELQLGDASTAVPSVTLANPLAPANDASVAQPTEAPVGVPRENLCTILIIHNDFESLMAAMMCATTAAAQGMDAAIYFSFWGVNLIRGERPRRDMPKEKISILQRIMQWMMPRGPRRQKMGKMHMGGMGLGMMNHFMRKNNVMSLAELMDSAVEQDVKFVVCSMSMGIMGIQKRDIMDLPNVEFGGVTAFVEMSRRSSMSLVF
jgi:peroxiredoxin family protein/TusA-related sulfurtransferase